MSQTSSVGPAAPLSVTWTSRGEPVPLRPYALIHCATASYDDEMERGGRTLLHVPENLVG